MSDVVIPLKQERRKGHPSRHQFYACLPKDFYGMVGGGQRVYLKTRNRAVAEDRLAALAVVAQIASPSIGEF